MKVLELKNGSVDVNNIDTYNCLKNKLDCIRKRLNYVINPGFKKSRFEFGNYITLTDTDDKLKQDIIDFLITKFTEQINEVITQMNNLIKE